MSNLTYTADLIADVLFRAGEPTDGTSDFAVQVENDLNRAYRAIWMGGGELLSGMHEEWHWLRRMGNFVISGPYSTGTASVTKNSTAVTLSATLTPSAVGAFFRVTGQLDLYRIATHTSGTAAMVLDGVYTGPTNAVGTFQLFRLEYSLLPSLPANSGILRLISPLRMYQLALSLEEPSRVDGMDLDAMEARWPLASITAGLPDAFAMVGETTIRFNRTGPATSADLARVEFDYLIRPAPLLNTVNEEPLVPYQYRHILADYALMKLWADKNDSRMDTAGMMAKAGLQAMASENRHKGTVIGSNYGRIIPRQEGLYPWRWRADW